MARAIEKARAAQVAAIMVRIFTGLLGGDLKNATRRNHGTHAEAIETTFELSQTSFLDPAGVLRPGGNNDRAGAAPAAAFPRSNPLPGQDRVLCSRCHRQASCFAKSFTYSAYPWLSNWSRWMNRREAEFMRYLNPPLSRGPSGKTWPR